MGTQAQTQTLDFSDLGARPVPQPGQAGGQLDFSDLGGKRVGAAQSVAPPVPAEPSQHFWQRGLVEDTMDPFGSIEGQTLKREGQSLWDTIKGTPGAVYHAFADPTTKEEMEESRGFDVFPGVTGISRLTAKPVKTAVDWYRRAAKGEIPDPIGQALSVAPEAMGTGAGSVIAGKLIENVPEAARTVSDAAGDVARNPTVRNIAGAPVRAGTRIAAQTLNKTIKPVLKLGTRIEDVGKVPDVRLPGENLGLPPNAGSAPVFPSRALGPDIPTEILQGRALRGIPRTDAAPASQTGEALGSLPRLVDQINAKAQPSLIDQINAKASAPAVNVTGRMPYPAGRNIDLSPGMETPGGAVVAPRVRGFLPSAPAEPPLPRLADQVKTTARSSAKTTLIERMGGKPVETITEPTSRPQLRPPVTENPAVGNLSRAMQKSGVPIADRPSLLLKGSGRVNRILGPDEDLTDAMAKSVRLAKRRRGQ